MLFGMFVSGFLILLLFSNSDLGINLGLVSGLSEKELLLQFRHNLTYDASVSTKLVHWNDSVDFCRWDGVKCDTKSRVSFLDLSGESISAGINDGSSLFKLSHLQTLNFAQNSFDSTKLPPQFGQLTELRYLNLSSSGFSGQIPLSFSNLTRLVVLDLHGNTFSSLFPDFFADFSKLQVLAVSSCDLSGVVPRKLFQIKSLETIDLSNNRDLQGSLPQLFPVNGSLQNLMLSYTRFSGNVPESIGRLKLLSNLDVRSCSYSGPIPSTIKNLTHLVYLDLSQNQFSASVPSFAFLKNLKVLNLRSNRLAGKFSNSHWEGLENVEFLDLSENSLQGEIPASLFALPLLKVLYLSNNSFSGSIKSVTTNISSPLEVVDLKLNNLEGSIPRIFFQLQILSSLSLSWNKFSGSLELTDFQKLTNLVNLDLSHNKLSVQAKEEVALSALFPRLGTLLLASCNLEKLPNLKNQPSLMMLDVSDNKLQGEIPNWLWRVGDDGFLLRFLNLSHNRFTHLQQPYNMRGLDLLDLHSNALTGEIPTPPPSVFIVDYSRNNFSSILPNIGSVLKRVMSFSASDNKISGTIPPSFCNATSTLRVLNLSNNSLHGRIPSCLQTFPESSFIGNDGLCGLPLNKTCGTAPAFPREENVERELYDRHHHQLENGDW